jgi:hypothetical protein
MVISEQSAREAGLLRLKQRGEEDRAMTLTLSKLTTQCKHLPKTKVKKHASPAVQDDKKCWRNFSKQKK